MEVWGVIIVLLVLMFFMGILGNVLVLIVFWKGWFLNSIFYILVVGLVWIDFIGIIMMLLVIFVVYLNDRKWFGGDEFCWFNGFVMVCFGLFMFLIVGCMVIEWFLVVWCIFSYLKFFNKGWVRVMLIVIWLFVLIIGILLLFGFGNFVV